MSPARVLTEDQRDCLQEVVNVAMGQAADSLARLLQVFINLSVPQIRLVEASKLYPALEEMIDTKHPVSAVSQGFNSISSGSQLRGEALVIFSQASYQEMAELMAFEDALDEAAEQELLMDVSNVLIGACLNGVAEQLEQELSYSPPSIIGQHVALKNVIDVSKVNWSQALLVEVKYTLEENRSFSCDLLFLMTDESIKAMQDTLDRILDEF